MKAETREGYARDIARRVADLEISDSIYYCTILAIGSGLPHEQQLEWLRETLAAQ